MSGSLSLLWGLIGSLQIVAHFPLLVINYPANAKTFSEVLLQLARFDIIPYSMLIEPTRQMLGFEENESDAQVIQSNIS